MRPAKTKNVEIGAGGKNDQLTQSRNQSNNSNEFLRMTADLLMKTEVTAQPKCSRVE